ncbi:ras-related and estrogen-regulated growth inhibitor [Eurytemora carolleeae]|uniref:ras-related and estrogen-regulated growth inhibitor n=1 Tax=Eurytemora carolleeae TaxID=1294199 RepID=UPI000C78BA42|nr:ras-related and estrogen-regulated growth inhibitor [Eurytemora carolleeae]|eukprot:XP_023345273.1 ras-related and estrogen-regulated growth inhibitor-like [Eurytemora affinis]
MNSNSGMRGIRQVRRKKSSLSEVKLVILGAPGVGKSALTVRFLTKRYIGEYDHQSDSRYKHEIAVDGDPVIFEICDTSTKSAVDLPAAELVSWADGLVLVYSITDRSSFTYLKQVFNHIQDVRGVAQVKEKDVPMLILGNKGDMVHLRQVSSEEGEILAKDFDCNFLEVAAADQVNEIAESFYELCREISAVRRKNKTSLLERVLGTKNGNRVYHRGKSDSSLSKY